MSDWQPIETAPKDGTRILVCGMTYGEVSGEVEEKSIEVSAWRNGGWFLLWAGDFERWWVLATHWMPLPQPL